MLDRFEEGVFLDLFLSLDYLSFSLRSDILYFDYKQLYYITLYLANIYCNPIMQTYLLAIYSNNNVISY